MKNIFKDPVVKKIFTKKCWKYFFISSILSILQVVCYVAIVLLMQYIQAAIENDSSKWLFPNLSAAAQVGIIAPIIIVICVLSITVGLLGNKYSVAFGKNITINFRSNMYKNIQTFSMVDINKFSQSSLINRMTIDVNNIATASEFFARVLLKSVLLYIGSIIGLIILVFQNSGNANSATIAQSMWIVWATIILSVALVVIIVLIAFFARKHFVKIQKNLDTINEITQENVIGQRTVKAFNLQSAEFQKFDLANEQLRKSSTTAGSIMALILPTIYFFLDVSLVIATWLSNSQLIGSLLQIFLLIGMMIIALVLSIFGIVQISRAIPSLGRTFQVLRYEPIIKYPEEEAQLSNQHDIVIKDLSFKYEHARHESLKNINLTIKQKEIVGIIGPTGSGKTTLINLIARMYDSTTGEIDISGVNIKDLTKHQLKSTISYCPQNIVLFSGTIKSNLLFGKPDATEEEINEAIKISNLDAFISKQEKGIDSEVTQRGTNLSGGQKQRLAIARAIIKKSPYLLLDDVTSALDMVTEKNICNELVKNAYKQTIILSSQKINSIKHANKILVMQNGEIIAIGSHKELLQTCQYYYDIARIQLGQKGVEDEINKK